MTDAVDTLAEYVEDVDPAETFACDLRVPLSDVEVTALLGGRPLRTYHATRLLSHEVESVRSDGLRALTPEHVEHRIADALAVGAISTVEADRLGDHTVYVKGINGRRSDQVCALLGLIVFSEGSHGVRPLLSTWGGEALYWHANGETLARLRSLGAPSVVVLDLPLTAASWRMSNEFGSALAGHLAGLLQCTADVFYYASVPASAVVSIWQPGAPDYDRFPDLPRA